MYVTHDVTGTLRHEEHGHPPLIFDARGNGGGTICPTITGDHQDRITDYTAIVVQNMEKYVDTWRMWDGTDIAPTLTKSNCGGGQRMPDIGNFNCVMKSYVRRLTPLECERLQGFPDGWTDIGEWTDTKGKKHKEADSPRYKALGNSIALPFWFYLLRRISATYERPATLGSLFDGIGGFPLCWERCNGKGTAVWASEIEEFPIAVTKIRFPE